MGEWKKKGDSFILVRYYSLQNMATINTVVEDLTMLEDMRIWGHSGCARFEP